MAGIESTYRYACSLFEKAKDCDIKSSKESYLKKAWGSAYLASTHDYPGASSLVREIEIYASAYNINVG